MKHAIGANECPRRQAEDRQQLRLWPIGFFLRVGARAGLPDLQSKRLDARLAFQEKDKGQCPLDIGLFPLPSLRKCYFGIGLTLIRDGLSGSSRFPVSVIRLRISLLDDYLGRLGCNSIRPCGSSIALGHLRPRLPWPLARG